MQLDTEGLLEMYRQVFYASPDYISFSTLDGLYIDVNPLYESITGYGRDEVIGRSSVDIGLWTDMEQRDAFVAALLRSGSVKDYSARFRIRSGEIRDFELSANIADVRGERIIVSVVRDVTERKRNEHELLLYRNRLEQMVELATRELASANVHLQDEIRERRAAEERVRYLAGHDALTGLPNRRLLEERLQQVLSTASRNGTKTAIQFIDLDYFKSINDTLGHRVGDMVLKAVASRMCGLSRDIDIVSRIGGDEFILVLPNIQSDTAATEIADRVLESLAQPYMVDGHTLTITPSIGISLYPDDGLDADTLITRADTAMYQAKNTGRKNYKLFGANLHGDEASKPGQDKV